MLVRTGKERALPDEKLLSTLHDLGLGEILERAGGLSAELDWHADLSFEEQRLMTLAQLALAGPCFAFLDRPVSAFESAHVHRALQRLDPGSIGLVTLGESAEVGGEYDAVLELEADGGWNWKPIGRVALPKALPRA